MIKMRDGQINVEKGAIYSVHLSDDTVKALMSCASYEPSFNKKVNECVSMGLHTFGSLLTIYLIADSFEEAEVKARYIFEQHRSKQND